MGHVREVGTDMIISYKDVPSCPVAVQIVQKIVSTFLRAYRVNYGTRLSR